MSSDNLTKAKAALILDQPFFASLLFGMELIEDTAVKTMATDGDNIRYNPAFVAGLTVQEIVFVLAHEVLHCALLHHTRRNGRDHKKWNVAADYVINDTLVRERVGTMIQGALHNPQLVQAGNGTAEGVYNALPDNPQGNQGKGKPQAGKGSGQAQGNQQGNGQQDSGYPGAGEPGGSMDDLQDAAQDEAGTAQKDAEMRVKVIQAANAAKMMGKLSGGMARLVGEITETRTDWRAVLRRFLSEKAKTDFSFAKPKRRFLADDIYLPSLIGERLGKIIVAVDCSGSINDTLLNDFAAEIKAICEDTAPELVRVIYFDSKVLKTTDFEPGEPVKLEPVGGGGTAFEPIFEHVDSDDIQPAAVVVLTDLYGSFPSMAPGYPVLWAATTSEQAPFGETVRIKE